LRGVVRHQASLCEARMVVAVAALTAYPSHGMTGTGRSSYSAFRNASSHGSIMFSAVKSHIV